MDLQDKVIVITGGAQGLGFCMAKAMVEAGAKVALVDLNDIRLKHAQSELESMGGTARIYKANVAKEAEVEQLFDDVARDFGALHGLINNAGVLRDGLMVKAKDGKVTAKMSLEHWQTVIDVNLTGVFLCGREASAKMIELGCEGVIVNISSVSREGNMGQTNYSAAKAGVASMTVVWSKELARHGIRCMGIAPGFVMTEMVASMKPEALDVMAGMIPLRRLGAPEEIAHTARFIFENDYLTGKIIETDGGIRL
ncbi:oxidoreductase, short chain dehydrogenase/reductase family [Luminiphilus syltensis NOR5-1B]|uniref:Oxidoreductase, short chain dehydrogenase/reductase family n=1 Tax=Luminiphilus syltensis NOR5-1B TaxID=565045 RepID=B8KVB2_9GAMM|nr:SDR family oxidoreductase [Luminiphilus syltensis]EED36270.1 oxidoreductase, short chain dehydrogenase/reductase family [Luminiphilus syltensis NOR5-1B]